MVETKTFHEQAKEWLGEPKSKRSIEIGAMLMLQANRNKIMHQNVLRARMFDRVEYELKKFLKNNPEPKAAIKKKAVDSVTKIEREVFEIAKTAERKGQREDHKELPNELQNLVNTNQDMYHRMRSLHEKLKVLSGKEYNSTARLPFLTQMIELNKNIAQNWKRYDDFKIGDEISVQKEIPTVESLSSQRINSNRTYLTRAGTQILNKIESGKPELAEKQLKEAQIRYDELIADGQKVDEKTADKLKLAGLKIV